MKILNHALLASDDELNGFTKIVKERALAKSTVSVKLRNGDLAKIQYSPGGSDADECEGFKCFGSHGIWRLSGKAISAPAYDLIELVTEPVEWPATTGIVGQGSSPKKQ